MLFRPDDPEDPELTRRGIEEARRAYAAIHAPPWTRPPVDDDGDGSQVDASGFYEACADNSNRVITERYVESQIPDSRYVPDEP